MDVSRHKHINTVLKGQVLPARLKRTYKQPTQEKSEWAKLSVHKLSQASTIHDYSLSPKQAQAAQNTTLLWGFSVLFRSCPHPTKQGSGWRRTASPLCSERILLALHRASLTTGPDRHTGKKKVNMLEDFSKTSRMVICKYTITDFNI